MNIKKSTSILANIVFVLSVGFISCSKDIPNYQMIQQSVGNKEKEEKEEVKNDENNKKVEGTSSKSTVLHEKPQIKDVPNSSIPYSLLDIYGNGQKQKIELPFSYYHPKPDDKLSIIYQGAYKVFNTTSNKNDIPILGMLNPCIGIAVTDGYKVITFHKHYSNSLKSLIEVIRDHINIKDPSKVYARLYTARNDKAWNEKYIYAHDNKKSVIDELRSIKDCLATIIKRENIVAQAYNLFNQKNELKYPDFALGLYDNAEIFVAVQVGNLFEESDGTKKIKFYNIDPYQEDIFGYKGKQIPIKLYLGEQTYKDQIKNKVELPEFISYNDLNCFDFVKNRNGFLENEYNSNMRFLYNSNSKYENFIDKINPNCYNTLNFFKLK